MALYTLVHLIIVIWTVFLYKIPNEPYAHTHDDCPFFLSPLDVPHNPFLKTDDDDDVVFSHRTNDAVISAACIKKGLLGGNLIQPSMVYISILSQCQ